MLLLDTTMGELLLDTLTARTDGRTTSAYDDGRAYFAQRGDMLRDTITEDYFAIQ